MREQIDRVMPLVREHLTKAQQAFLATWQGPYTVTEKVGPVTYRVRQPGRRKEDQLPEARRHAIEEEVQEMLRLGVIEPSRSPWSSPIVMVPKPDGTLRFCNDFRQLNEVSEFDGYPMPRVDELLDRLGGTRYISTLDLTKGYWQVPLTEQRLTGQPRTRARHGGQPLESTSTARRTATGEHEHKSSGEHRSPTHDREKPTSPKPH